jgi:hypothetical protein
VKLGTLALILPVALLAACSKPPAVVVQQPRGNMALQGIDVPHDASDALNEIRDSKIDFVARYYRSPTSRWPALSAREAQGLSALGLNLVTVWEWHSHQPEYFSYNSGYADGISAYNQAKTVGQPPGSAIYFAVDYNARSADIDGPIRQYFQGVNAALAAASGGRPDYKVGVYGSGAVCDAMKRGGLARYAWLTGSVAWTGTYSYDDWNIRQGGHFSVLSFNHDANEAKEDYGGFRVAGGGAAPVAAPAPAPSSADPVIAATPPPSSAAPVRDIVAPEQPQDGPWTTIAKMFSL